MVKHMIIWQLTEDLSAEKKETILKEMKKGLEGLKGVVPEVLECRVIIDPLPSSNADAMLDSAFADAEALKRYQISEEHQAVANTWIRPYTKVRCCVDYEC